MPAAEIVGAIRGNDAARLTRIPGIGRKTAERMVLELRDKLDDFDLVPAPTAATPVEEDVLSALANLGYQRAAAERALIAIAKNGRHAERVNGEAPNFEVLFREALSALSK